MILEFKSGKEGYKVMRGFEDRAKLVRAKVLTQGLRNVGAENYWRRERDA